MHNIVISDTSCLIILNKIGQLEILKKVYDNVITTPEVAEEFSEILPDWIIIKVVQDKKYQEFLETQIDPGEASAIALAKEIENSLLLLDDLKDRKLAGKLNLRFTGTLGVITKAKQIGVIRAVKPIIESLLLTYFRISGDVIDELLKLNKENT
jgi:predicted nucleic acid-binding protein